MSTREVVFIGPSYFDLGRWIEENAPGMYEKVKYFTPLENLGFLNGVTGLTIDAGDEIDRGSMLFLERLKQMKADGKLPD